MKAAVIGHPIAHSKSPLIHEYWMEQHGITGSYERIDIHPDNLEVEVKNLIQKGYDGFNVTVPHKEAIFALCDEVDKSAQVIGAVNTVIIKEGKLIGKNTDAYGFIQNIKNDNLNFSFKNKNVFILGAGGAARAIIYGLLEEGVSQIKLSNRTKEKAELLSQMNLEKIEVIDWPKRQQSLKEADLLVNSTSLGMSSKSALDIDLTDLTPSALVNDIVYVPLMTDLLQAAQGRGNNIITGIGMLLHQARPAFEAWTGIQPEVTPELEDIVLK